MPGHQRVLDTLSCVRVGELSSVGSHEATSFFEKPDFAHLDLSTEGDAILPFAPQLSAPRLALPAPTLRVAVSGLPAHLSRSPRPSSVPSLPHPAHPAPAPRAHSVCTGAHSWGPALLIAPPPRPSAKLLLRPTSRQGAPRPPVGSLDLSSRPAGFAGSLDFSVTLTRGVCGELGHGVSRVGLCPAVAVSKHMARGTCSVNLSGRNEEMTSCPGGGRVDLGLSFH